MQLLFYTAAAVLFLQGVVVCSQRGVEPNVRGFGFLTAFIAVSILIAYVLVTSGQLVLAREFGYVIASRNAYMWLQILLLGTSLVAGFGWRSARLRTGETLDVRWYLGAGLVVGLLSIKSIKPITVDDALPGLVLYYYDVWSPMLALWLTASLVGAVLSMLRWESRIKLQLRRERSVEIDAGQVCGISSAATILAFAALAERSGVFDDGIILWDVLLYVASPLALAAACFALSRTHKKILAYAVVGLGPATIAVFRPEEAQRLALGVWILGLLAASWPLPRVLVARFSQRGFTEAPASDASWNRRRGSLIAFLILVIGASLTASVVGFGNVNIAVTLAVFMVAWAVLNDVVWEDGIFVRAWQLIRKPTHFVQRLNHTIKAIGAGLGAVLLRSVTALSAGSWYAAGFKIFLSVVVLVALAQLPNAGRTIVMPFNVSREAGDAEFGDQLSNHVVYELRMLVKERSREITIASQNEQKRSKKKLSVTEHELGGSTESLVKSGSIPLPGGLQFPVELLVLPIQGPARWLFNVNVINGNVVKTGTGLAVMATSSRGDVWRAVSPQHEDTGDECIALTKVTDTDSTAVDMIAKRLAFQIVFDVPDTRFERVTRNWDAYLRYSKGLEFFERHIALGRYDQDNLQKAIACLRRAATLDPTSPLTHYRLGLALQEDGQRFPAIDAFQRSLDVDPRFVAAKVAMGFLRSSPQLFTNSLPPGAIEPTPGNQDAPASSLWITVAEDPSASLNEIATAYLWLANLSFKQMIAPSSGDASDGPREDWKENPRRKAAALFAYYNARRAVDSYDEQKRRGQTAVSIAAAHASALNWLGVVLDSVAQEPKAIPQIEWTCTNGVPDHPITETRAGPYTREALDYYKAALAEFSADPVISCNAAHAALNLGDSSAMRQLQSVAEVRRYTADQLGDPKDLATLRRKLREYEAAVQINQVDTVSSNSFAYTYYQYRRDHPIAGDDAAQLLSLGANAERHARDAIRKANAMDQQDVLMYKSTLAEVLVSLHRYEEAAKILEELKDEIPDHPSFYEIKWDLAQTYKCIAEANDGDAEYLAKAQKVLNEIRERDQSLAVPLYDQTAYLLDALLTQGLCNQAPEYSLLGNNGIQVAFEVTQDRSTTMKPCDRNVLRVWAPEPGTLGVEVWGEGGVYNFEIVPDTNTVYTVLSWKRRDSHGKYFTRLWEEKDNKYVPVSSVKAIDTFADCGRNTIDLWYERVSAARPPELEPPELNP